MNSLTEYFFRFPDDFTVKLLNFFRDTMFVWEIWRFNPQDGFWQSGQRKVDAKRGALVRGSFTITTILKITSLVIISWRWLFWRKRLGNTGRNTPCAWWKNTSPARQSTSVRRGTRTTPSMESRIEKGVTSRDTHVENFQQNSTRVSDRRKR